MEEPNVNQRNPIPAIIVAIGMTGAMLFLAHFLNLDNLTTLKDTFRPKETTNQDFKFLLFVMLIPMAIIFGYIITYDINEKLANRKARNTQEENEII